LAAFFWEWQRALRQEFITAGGQVLCIALTLSVRIFLVGSILESKATMIEVDRNNPSYSMSKDR
jgi:hypothetical protein